MRLDDRARRLRASETDAERKLWFHLRDRRMRGLTFRRQHPIGPFVADFYCPQPRLVIEVDRSQHSTQLRYDRRPSEYLARQGYGIPRFWDNEVLQQTDTLPERIHQLIDDPHPGPFPGKEREEEGR